MHYNNSQSRAICHKDGPMLVLAGPGSGKTAVITKRTEKLITEYKVPPENILVITFTRAAAAEMRKRFELLTGEHLRVTFGTFHAVFFQILKNAYHYTGQNIITGEQQYQFLRQIISHYHLDYQDEGEMIRSILAEISLIKNSRLELKNYYSVSCGEEIFRKIYSDYEKRMGQNRLIDYDDMQKLTLELFQQRPDILAAWQKRFTYILVDEFQDINRIQYDIVRMLAEPLRNIFAVGDDDQSIYRFRGSKPEIMLNFEKDYPKAEKICLEVNYRCAPYIVETAGNLISHNKERFPKKIRAAGKGSFPVRYLTFENRRAENRYILGEIVRRVKEGAEYKDFAILFRTNTQPRLLAEMLSEYNLPFRIREKLPDLYEHWIARDIFAYLRLAAGSRAREDFLQIMNRPKRYLSRDSLTDSRVDFETWKKYYEEQPWIAERIEKLEYDLKLLKKMSPYAAINYIRRGIGYEDFLQEFAEKRQLEKSDLTDILEEIHMGAKCHASYDEWQNQIRLYSAKIRNIAAAKEQNPESIFLATLHSAKGLEFDTVFLIDVNEGIMPYKKALLDKEIEEERRLFYVGMTRAKTNLFLCSVRSLYDRKAQVSRFIEETKKPLPLK